MISARITSENPDEGFKPTSGTVQEKDANFLSRNLPLLVPKARIFDLPLFFSGILRYFIAFVSVVFSFFELPKKYDFDFKNIYIDE